MTVDECIEALKGIKERYPSGGDIEVAIGVGFGNGGKIETLSLQAEPSEDENQIVFEEEFLGDREPALSNEEWVESVRGRLLSLVQIETVQKSLAEMLNVHEREIKGNG